MERGKYRFSYATEDRLHRNLLYVVTSHASSVLVSFQDCRGLVNRHPHMPPSRLRGGVGRESVGKARPQILTTLSSSSLFLFHQHSLISHD